MFAETDVFWRWPTVYDVLSVVGLVLGILSIWIAFHLARKQLRADFRKAADEAVDRVAQLVLGGDLADAVRFLRDADRAIVEKDWDRGQLRLDDTASMIARFAYNPKLLPQERERLVNRVGDVRTLLLQVREHSRSPGNRGHLPKEQSAVVFTMISELEHLRGRLMTGASVTAPGGTYG